MTEIQVAGDVVPVEVLEAVETTSIKDDVLDLLLEKVERDRYPSPAMLDDIEQLLTPGRRQAYADILMEKIRADRFPSRTMIQRLLRLSQ